MECTLYLEIEVLCITILFNILYRTIKYSGDRTFRKYFIGTIVSGIIFVVSDLIWGMITYEEIAINQVLFCMLNIIYFSACGVLTYIWFLYSEILQKAVWLENSIYKIITALPVIILIGASCLSGYTGWIFQIKNGEYSRGPLFFLEFIIPCFYLIVTGIRMLIKAHKKENYIYRDEYISVASFVIMPLLVCLLQIRINGTPLSSIGLTLGIMWAYERNQAMQISLDPLTKVHNRIQMVRYLSGKMNHGNERKKSLYLMIIDIDDFKTINDQYGHIEGDNALIRMATVLKNVGWKIGGFAVRFGGDEFIFIYESNELMPETVSTYLENAAAMSDSEANSPYTIKFSIGYAKYDSEADTIPELLKRADKRLYEMKSFRKGQM